MADWLRASMTAVLLAALWPLAGCNRPPSVEGDVSYDGQPVEIGRILFVPEDTSLPKRGGRFEKGHYSLEPPEAPSPGKHRVEINWLKPTGETYKNEFGEVLPRLSEGLPEKYHTSSTLTADVKAGKNVIDFKLEK